MHNLNKDDFERTLQIAEYARQSGENRRQYEFKIFISYVTLLILGIYEGHHIEIPSGDHEALYRWGVLVLLFVVHFVYIAWTISLSVANQNDGVRRNFYLQKSEYISKCLLKKFGDPLSRKLESDYPEFLPNEKIKIVPRFYQVERHIDQLWINYAATFQAALPTIIFILLLFNFSEKLETKCWHVAVVIMGIILLLIVLNCLHCLCQYLKKDKTKEGNKPA